jgi:hypothetical protein
VVGLRYLGAHPRPERDHETRARAFWVLRPPASLTDLVLLLAVMAPGRPSRANRPDVAELIGILPRALDLNYAKWVLTPSVL